MQPSLKSIGEEIADQDRAERVKKLDATSAHIDEVLNITDAITERVLSSRTYQHATETLGKVNDEVTRGIKMIEGAIKDLEGTDKRDVVIAYLDACRENMRQGGAAARLILNSTREVTLAVLSKVEPKVITKLLKKNFT